MCEGGRERVGIELVEYCDQRFLDACDIGLGSALLRAGGEVINGGRAGWADDGEVSAGGDVAGEEEDDMTAVILDARCGRPRPKNCGRAHTLCAA
jgi:hypothetical protein